MPHLLLKFADEIKGDPFYKFILGNLAKISKAGVTSQLSLAKNSPWR